MTDINKIGEAPSGENTALAGTEKVPSHIGLAGGTFGTSDKFVFSFDYFRVI